MTMMKFCSGCMKDHAAESFEKNGHTFAWCGSCRERQRMGMRTPRQIREQDSPTRVDRPPAPQTQRQTAPQKIDGIVYTNIGPVSDDFATMVGDAFRLNPTIGRGCDRTRERGSE